MKALLLTGKSRLVLGQMVHARGLVNARFFAGAMEMRCHRSKLTFAGAKPTSTGTYLHFLFWRSTYQYKSVTV